MQGKYSVHYIKDESTAIKTDVTYVYRLAFVLILFHGNTYPFSVVDEFVTIEKVIKYLNETSPNSQNVIYLRP